MKLASICIARAKARQKADGIIQNFEKKSPLIPTNVAQANTAPTRTGAAAPVRVFGRAANIQAFRELVFTCIGLESLQGEFDDLLYGSGRVLAEDVPYHLF